MHTLTRRASLALLAPVLVAPATRAFAQDLPTVRVVGPANDGMTPIYYGASSGLFKRYGLNVVPTTVNNGAAALAAVVGGSAEVAFTNMLAVFQIHLRGIPVQIIAPSSWYLNDKPTTGLMVLKDSPLRGGRDLGGKTVSSPSLKDLNSAAIMAWVDKSGGDSKAVKIVELPAATALPALLEGRVDVATMIEPALSQALSTGKTRVLGRAYDAIADRFMVTAMAAVGTYVDQNRDTMARFARAMHESIVFVNTHPADTVDLLAQWTGATPDQIAHSMRISEPEYVEARNIQPLLDALVKYGVIEHGFPLAEIISPVAVKPPGRA